MPIPPDLVPAYRTFWGIAQDVAQAKEPDGTYTFRVTDLSTVVRDAYAAMGLSVSFQQYSQLPQLFSLARLNDRAVSILAGADPGSPITMDMVGSWPTAAPVSVQDAQPEYFARAEFTYTNMLGEQSTGWVSITGMTQLPLNTTALYNMLQGAAMQSYSVTPDAGGSPKSDAEVMQSFGEFGRVELYAV